MTLEGEGDQAVDQLGVAEAGGFPHLRVASRPRTARSTTILRSSPAARSTAAGSAAASRTLLIPTLEPRFAGLTKHGKPSVWATRAATRARALRHSCRWTTTYSAIGRPCAWNTALIVTLSMPTAEARTLAPT